MVTNEEKLIAEMDNLLANVNEDKKLIISALLDIRTAIVESLVLVDTELIDMGVDPSKTTEEIKEEW
tara:strand:- start:18297 stop:18497 length:201 start_codon:yes stop_codon:yes gene_type:complete